MSIDPLQYGGRLMSPIVLLVRKSFFLERVFNIVGSKSDDAILARKMDESNTVPYG